MARPKLVSALAICGFLLATTAFAQTTGAITGTVTDPNDASVAGAKVTVRSMDTGEERNADSSSTGQYVFNALPVGRYEISAAAPGFKRYLRSNIQLDVANRLALNLRLEVGEVNQTLVVGAEAPVIETEKGDVSFNVSTRQVTDLGVNGRTITMLEQLAPGASRTIGDEGGVGFNSAKGFAINGTRPKYTGIVVDGVENSDQGSRNTQFVSPGLESVSEFRVQTSNYSAEYGSAAGANVLVVSRSGTKDFHAAAYEFVRNNAFDARNFFATKNPTLRYNNFGYRIGGPVFLPKVYNLGRDKTFFFWSQEWRKRRTQDVFRAATPTVDMIAGNFQAESARLGKPILDPASGQPFPNNIIPSNRLNQNALLLLNSGVFPKPNAPGFLNFQTNAADSEDFRQDNINITHNFGSKMQAMFRYTHDAWVQSQPAVLWAGQSFPTIGSSLDVPGRSLVAKVTNIISPTLLNEFSYTYSGDYGPKDQRAVTLSGAYLEPAGLNIPRLFPRIAGRPKKIPNLNFSGGWGNVDTSFYPWWAHHKLDAFTESLSKTIGSHSFKFGGTAQRGETPVESQVNPADQGGFSFNGSFTNSPIADFLLGKASQYQELNALLAPVYIFPQFEAYAQDTWKVSSRLSINLGVRYFLIPHAHEQNDLISNFRPDKYDPAKAVTVLPNGTIQSGSGDLANGMLSVSQGLPRTLVASHFGTFAPRIGFAWDPTGSGRTSLRGGYGIGYYRVEGNDTYRMVGNPPRSKLVTVFNPLLDNPGAGQAAADRPVSVNSLDPVYRVPMVQSYSLGLQRQIGDNIGMSIGYVGSRGTHLDRARNINQPLPINGYDFDPRLNSRAVPTELLRPYLGYASISQAETTASSTYHALQATLQKRFSKGLMFEAAYTYSRAITDASDFGESPQNAYNARAERGPASFDRTHMLIINYIYELPFLRGNNGFAGRVLGGWQMSGITQFQGGTPLNVGLTGGNVGLATRPDVVSGQKASGPKTIREWFNVGAFQAPAAGHFGDAGRNLLRGPGFQTWDIALFKNFRLIERLNTQFRVETFNGFNHTNFSGVSTTFGAGNFGQVTSARTARVLQFGAKAEF